MNTSTQTSYTGRFAPSPSGPLHLGSLTCALASYLDARQQGGRWLLRIEDIDPQRQPPGATDAILSCLDAHGLHWDEQIWLQSQASERYQKTLGALAASGWVYPCTCTRKRLANQGGLYDGFCRNRQQKPGPNASLRLDITRSAQEAGLSTRVQFSDRVYGLQTEELQHTSGDFVVHRKQNLFAYQLVVVLDDIAQGVTDVVRGSDLLPTTGRQLYLYQLLGTPPPRYGHVPVVVAENGLKLSKQNHAPALDNRQACKNLCLAMTHLGLDPPGSLHTAGMKEVLDFAQHHFSLEHLALFAQ